MKKSKYVPPQTEGSLEKLVRSSPDLASADQGAVAIQRNTKAKSELLTTVQLEPVSQNPAEKPKSRKRKTRLAAKFPNL